MGCYEPGVGHVEIEAELIELDELGEMIPGWESVPASGSPAECAAAAIDTVIHASSDTSIGDRQTIDTIASCAAHINR